MTWNRMVAPHKVPEEGLTVILEATPADCTDLAERLLLPAVAAAKADLRVLVIPDGLRVEGRLYATLTQICGVTLEPFESVIEAPLAQVYLHALHRTPDCDDVNDPDAEDPPEPLDPRGIDLGDLAAQNLALALDPFPRLPGAALDHETIQAGDETMASGAVQPFAVLAALKTGTQPDDESA